MSVQLRRSVRAFNNILSQYSLTDTMPKSETKCYFDKTKLSALPVCLWKKQQW